MEENALFPIDLNYLLQKQSGTPGGRMWGEAEANQRSERRNQAQVTWLIMDEGISYMRNRKKNTKFT